MDATGTGIGRLDCYEDMFKEITRKLYGEDPDHRTSNVQNEFEAASEFNKASGSAAASQEEDNASDSSWTLDDEPVKGCAEGTRIAAYRASTSTWRCYECGECMGGGPREVADHFLDQHSSRLLPEENGRGRHQGESSPRNLVPHVDELVAHLARFRERAERQAPPSRRTQMTQTIPATLMPVVTSSFLQLQDLPAALAPTAHLIQSPAVSLTTALSSPSAPPAPQQQQQQPQQQQHHQQPSSRSSKRSSHGSSQDSPGTSAKRYKCNCCSYSTDRRDLYTRHENIHREEKPFHCYICFKPFSRADHVKKHFLRMHKGHKYELARIRTLNKHSSSTTHHQPTESNNNNNNINNNSRCSSNASSYPSSLYSAPTTPVAKPEPVAPPPAPQQQAPPPPPAPEPPTVTTYQLQPPPPTPSVQALYQAAAGMSSVVLAAANSIMQQQQQQQHQQQPEAAALTPVAHRRPAPKSNPGVKSSSSSGSSGSSSSKNQERRYTCCYCSWSGVDNWCLKRHLNTHTKPFACALCEYKAARAERLATHVLKVHNRRQCSRCSFVVDDLAQLQLHQLHVHRVSNPGTAAAAAASSERPQQVLSLHTAGNSSSSGSCGSVGGGRAPPGPPVFPPPSAAIAPATTVISPTTMLGSEIAATADSWEQKSPAESRFTDSMDSTDAGTTHQGSSRRKQTQPRKCIQEKPTPAVEPTFVCSAPPARLYRCLECPRNALARRYSYLTSRTLRLHKILRHRRKNRSRRKRTGPTSITLRAVVAPITKDTCSKSKLAELTKVT